MVWRQTQPPARLPGLQDFNAVSSSGSSKNHLVWRVEADLLEDALEHGVQSARPDVVHRRVDLLCQTRHLLRTKGRITGLLTIYSPFRDRMQVLHCCPPPC